MPDYSTYTDAQLDEAAQQIEQTLDQRVRGEARAELLAIQSVRNARAREKRLGRAIADLSPNERAELLKRMQALDLGNVPSAAKTNGFGG